MIFGNIFPTKLPLHLIHQLQRAALRFRLILPMHVTNCGSVYSYAWNFN